MTSVLQEWVMELPLKMQSVLMTATRGPDDYRHESIKVANRWVRSKLFYDADPNNPFIIKPGDTHITNRMLMSQLQRDLEYTTVHYFGHFIHAFQIIGYKHPGAETRRHAEYVYIFCCKEILHLPTENRQELDVRLWSPEQGVIHNK